MADNVPPDGAPSGGGVGRPGVTQRFPGVVANADVDFEFAQGEVHTLLGENGAGKSTPAAMLRGLYQPDEGQILRSASRSGSAAPREGLAHGIGMVHQHFRLIPRFTVAENVILGDPGSPLLMKPGEAEGRVGEISERFGCRWTRARSSPTSPSGSASGRDRQGPLPRRRRPAPRRADGGPHAPGG